MRRSQRGWRHAVRGCLAFLMVVLVSVPVWADEEAPSLSDLEETGDTIFEAPSESPINDGGVESNGFLSEESETLSFSGMTQMSLGGGEGGEGGSSGPVGDLSLAFVDRSVVTGAGTVRIPIVVPPGRGGMAPDLSLTYNSQRANGWAGVGWDLDLGAIERSTKRGVDYEGHAFVFIRDGASSELVPRGDWGENSYGPRIEEEFSRYFLNPETGGWEVTAKDGTRYFYGTAPDSRQENPKGVFRWCLDRVLDTNGNDMEVFYTKDQGEIYLDRIDYTGNANLGPSNSIRFYLETRGDTLLSYRTGSGVKTACRLKTIDILANHSRVRTYKLSYDDSTATGRSLLSSVQRFGTDAVVDESGAVTGGSTLPEIVLSYTPENGGTFVPTGIYSPVMGAGESLLSDVNGDGISDLIWVYLVPWYDHCAVYVWEGHGNGTFSTSATQTTFTVTNLGVTGSRVGDVNGDGMADTVLLGSGVVSYSPTGVCPHKLVSVSNDMGGLASLEYTPSSQYQNTFLPFVVHPVSSITVDDGLGHLSITGYTYSGGYYDAENREFRGFESVRQTNPDRTVEETWFHQDNSLKGRPYQVDFWAPDGDSLLRRTTLTWDRTFIDSPENTAAFVTLNQKRTEFYDGTTVYTQEDYTYDETNGNLLSTVTSGTGGETVTTTHQYGNYGQWLWRLEQ